jgi:hypothetical protein
MGELLLTEKESTGLVIKGIGSSVVPRPRWAVVGKVFSSRSLVIGALDRAMQRAWGLHRPAQFRDIGDNRFVVRFSSEGDWKHAMKNGPWQFDFNLLLLKDYDGSIHPSDMVFDSMDIWIMVQDLPMDMMNRVYGQLIGNWVGCFISVEVDEDGMAWGKDLRIRVAVRVDQPLVRGVPLKDSDGDSKSRWFDIKYECIPHFYFDCGCLVHSTSGYSAERGDTKQWGEWLCASPRKNQKPPAAPRPIVSGSRYSSWMGDRSQRHGGEVVIRHLPPRRNLAYDQLESGSSRTGGLDPRKERAEVNSPGKDHRVMAHANRSGKAPTDAGGNEAIGERTFKNQDRRAKSGQWILLSFPRSLGRGAQSRFRYKYQ